MKNAKCRMQNRGLSGVCAGILVAAYGMAGLGTAAMAQEGELLYNGIRLPAEWPPKDRPVSYEPMEVPYWASPPDPILIDVGRQLFVDDFLVAETNLKRTHHKAEYWPGNPVMAPDKPWEDTLQSNGYPAPTAMPFSDGVFFDPQDGLFKMWYIAGFQVATGYATSKDGIHWEKPALDVVEGTNLVETTSRDSATVWLDLTEQDPAKRYKMVLYLHEATKRLTLSYSPDGIHWTQALTGDVFGDRTTLFYNAFRKVWVYDLRDYDHTTIGRYRRYREAADIEKGLQPADVKPTFWMGADKLDPQRADLKTPCELYAHDAVSYESVLLGLFTIWRGQPQDRGKPNEICVGYSRDGFHWDRPMREAFIPVSETYGDWNWSNVQSVGGCCLVVKDKLYFYMSGRKGVQGSPASGFASTGLATLRRDGFASMDTGGTEGTLLTRPVQFSGKFLFVNVNAPEGELRVEVCSRDGKVIEPFTREACVPVKADSCLQQVQWNSGADLSSLAGKPVQFRFSLRNGSLYAFWVSPEKSGASHGYVAAGGPGFTGIADTVGKGAI